MTYRELLARNAVLEAELVRMRQELAIVRAELTSLRGQLDQVIGLAATQNDRMGQLTEMLRRREDQARMRRPSSLDPGDDDTPPAGPTATGGGAGAQTEGRPASAPVDPKPPRKPRTSAGPIPVPPHLPKTTTHIGVCACAYCGSTNLLKRDTEVSLKLSIPVLHFSQEEIIRDVLRCKDCNHTTTAAMPPMPLARSKFTCEFLAWVVVQKFVLLVPLDRISRRLRTMGVVVPESTLVYLIGLAAELLGPIDGEHWKQLKRGPWMQMDGSGLKVLIVGEEKAWDGYVEVFIRLKTVVYQFSLTKHADELAARMEGFTGDMLCDAESRHNEALAKCSGEANCNAHARRKFSDAEAAHEELAKEGGAYLTAMYAVEANARDEGVDLQTLGILRQTLTRPIVAAFRVWLEGVAANKDILKKDPLRSAVQYYLKHFDALTYFVDHPHIPIDNNECERHFQNHAKLRLNSLFAGSPEGGHRWAVLAGIAATARNYGIDVMAYLVWAFERRGTWKKRFNMRAAELTPEAYAAALAEAQKSAA